MSMVEEVWDGGWVFTIAFPLCVCGVYHKGGGSNLIPFTLRSVNLHHSSSTN